MNKAQKIALLVSLFSMGILKQYHNYEKQKIQKGFQLYTQYNSWIQI